MRPVFPQPGYTEDDVLDLIATRQFIGVDTFTFILPNADKFRYASAQRNLFIVPLDDGGGGVPTIYRADDIKVSGLRVKLEVSVNVDESDMLISYKPTNLIYGQTWGAAVSNGLLDGSIIRRDRFFAKDWFSPWIGGTPIFLGRASVVDEIGRQDIKLKVKSYLVLADIMMPKELTQPSCRNTLFDTRCTLVKSAHGVNGTVGAGSNNAIINWSGALTTFTLGTIEMESGPAIGQSANIKQATGTQLILSAPFFFEPAPGDIFIAFPGCDKTVARCTALGNLDSDGIPKHAGFPFVPPPETAV